MGGLVLPGLLGAAALGLLAFGVVLFARHRRAPSGTAQPPVPASPVQPTAPAALPATLPEQKAASPASTTKAAFKRTEDEYFKLKGQLATGRITREQFEARLRELMVQDQQGRYWLLGADTGKWFVHEADGWVEREPE
jgi:hypothetical protein